MRLRPLSQLSVAAAQSAKPIIAHAEGYVKYKFGFSFLENRGLTGRAGKKGKKGRAVLQFLQEGSWVVVYAFGFAGCFVDSSDQQRNASKVISALIYKEQCRTL